MLRVCIICKQEKDFETEFYSASRWRRKECKSCVKMRVSEYRKRNPEKLRSTYLTQDFGITIEQYNKLFADQNGCCAICDAHPSKSKRNFAVDHNHATGKIRGILCGNCNTAIGKLGDDPDIMRRAIEYVDGNNQEVSANISYLPRRGRRGGALPHQGRKPKGVG